jgi:hypothetical protein
MTASPLPWLADVQAADSKRTRQISISSVASDSSESARVEMSLCGGLDEVMPADQMRSRFNKSLISYQQFCSNPNMVSDPKLVLRINGDQYFNWAVRFHGNDAVYQLHARIAGADRQRYVVCR